MKNKKTFYDRYGNPITIELLLTFKIEELNKTFISFTINDDDTKDTAEITLMQIIDEDTSHPKLLEIDKKDEPLVIEVFNKLKED